MTFWFDASFGDFPLRIASIRTADGRDIVVQSPARGSRHFLQDRGAKLGKVDAEILFVEEPRTEDFRDRFDAFRALIAKGEAQVFSHPLIGSYLAVAEGGEHYADSSRMITFSCSFYPESDPQTVSQVLAGTSPIAGVQAVEVGCEEADAALDDIGLETDATGEALDMVTAWGEAEDLDSQDVIVGVESLTSSINEAIAEMELAASLERWPAYQAMVNLAYAVRRAGQAFTSSSEEAIPLTVDADTPLLAICAAVYGAELASEMSDKVARRNRLRRPGLVPRGTTLSMPGV